MGLGFLNMVSGGGHPSFCHVASAVTRLLEVTSGSKAFPESKERDGDWCREGSVKCLRLYHRKETKVSCSVGTRLWRAGGAGGVVWGYIIRLFLRIIHLVVCKCMTEWFGTQ